MMPTTTNSAKLDRRMLNLEKEVRNLKTNVKHLKDLLLKIKSFGEKAENENDIKAVEKLLDDA